MLLPYKNEPFTDFSLESNAEAMRQALATVKEQLGQTYPLIINGEAISTDDTATSTNPAKPDQVIGYHAQGTVEHVEQAIGAAAKAYETWQFVPAPERAGYVLKAASTLR